MRRWFRPRSRSFRVVLGIALLAWIMLASGAFAAPLQGWNAMKMAMTTPTAPLHTTTDCDGMPMQQAATQQIPTAPMGHGECCHGGCACMTACNAVLAVPRLTIAVSLPRFATPVFATVGPAQLPSAPPLRPPIA